MSNNLDTKQSSSNEMEKIPEDDVMSRVTHPKYDPVAESTPSGTCATVSQYISKFGPSKALKPESKICLQSKSIFTSELPQVPYCPSVNEIQNLLNDEHPLWEDESFPANDSSLYKGARPNYLPPSIQWKRPHELVQSPQLVTNGITRFDINQGRLGDCWFIAAVAGLAMNEKLFIRVLPPNQSFANQYYGAFTVRFYLRGEWKDIVVDDRLPTSDGKLIFLYSDDAEEFWPALVEKAFAKLHGSYHGLTGGTYGEANSYFGGITENFNINGPQVDGLDPVQVKERLLEAEEQGSLCGGAIFDFGSSADSGHLGLPVGHAYTLTGFTSAQIRVRNPWGQHTEWVEQTSPPDGEFWMDWIDFMTFFHQVQVSHYSLDSAAGLATREERTWSARQITGVWDQTNCGGCPNFETYKYNTQYQLTVSSAESTELVLLIAIDQFADARLPNGVEKHAIGFIIYRSNPGEQISAEHLLGRPWMADSGIYRYQKQVVGRYTVSPGTYTIIPTTFHPGRQGAYLLRIFFSQY